MSDRHHRCGSAKVQRLRRSKGPGASGSSSDAQPCVRHGFPRTQPGAPSRARAGVYACVCVCVLCVCFGELVFIA